MRTPFRVLDPAGSPTMPDPWIKYLVGSIASPLQSQFTIISSKINLMFPIPDFYKLVFPHRLASSRPSATQQRPSWMPERMNLSGHRNNRPVAILRRAKRWSVRLAKPRTHSEIRWKALQTVRPMSPGKPQVLSNKLPRFTEIFKGHRTPNFNSVPELMHT